MFRFGLLAIAFVALTACAPTLGVQGKFAPASGLPVGAYRTLVVVPFDGFRGAALSRELEGRLASARFEGKPVFTIVPPPPDFDGDDIDAGDAIELGRRLGVDAVLAGRASEYVRNDPYFDGRDVCVERNDKGNCVRYVREEIRCDDITAEVTVFPRLIDARTGQVVYSKTHRGSARDRRCDAFVGSSLETSLLSRAREDALRDIRFDLAPYEKKLDAKLKDATDGLTPEQKTEFKRGMDFAKAEDTAQACAIWRRLKDQGASALSLQFNLGVCAEAAGDFDAALRMFEDLRRGLAQPDDDVTEALARVRGQIEERERLKTR